MSEGGTEAHLVIWGTDVNVTETKKQFRLFLRQFVDDMPSDDDDEPMGGVEPLYLQRLEEVLSLVICIISWDLSRFRSTVWKTHFLMSMLIT